MRGATKKRKPVKTPQRWLFLLTGFILLFIIAFGLYFREIQTPKWSADYNAEARAIEAAKLASVETVYSHTWHKKSWIVSGTDEENNKVYVWVTDDKDPVVIQAADSIAYEELKNVFLAEKPDASIKRVQPGLFDDKPVWEIFYSMGSSPERYYYEFYTFDSGAFIDEYSLPAKTEP
ncbi:DUF5590 domain-containing protein [Paenibacillus sp. sgz302251]|uniref:cell wall elongation regulator TseB-like domain-containing protein n=1 Tax=Paenibacillus sp. sgz302251 TaxID=3414493 RepID=UPI003C7980A7